MAIEYNKPAYLCFIDLTKAFDKIMLENVMNKLDSRGVPAPEHYGDCYRELNTSNTTTIRVKLTTEKIEQKNRNTTRSQSQSTAVQCHNGHNNRTRYVKKDYNGSYRHLRKKLKKLTWKYQPPKQKAW